MNLIPVTPEMLVFDNCGRLVPPVGYVFLDLVRVMPLRLVQPGGSEGEPPSLPVVRRVSNQTGTIFYALGLAGSNSGLSFSLRWPSGRSLQVRRVAVGEVGINFPLGQNNHQWCFESPVPVGPGDSITVDCPAGFGGSVDLQFWGFVRWLLTVDEAAGAGLDCNCLVGYPAGGGRIPAEAAAMLPGVAEVQAHPRYSCDPVGQNLAATAVQLGNQAYDPEPCEFETASVSLGYNEGVFDQRVIVPFIGLISITGIRLRVFWSANWPLDVSSDIQYSIRMPDGFQITGTDQVSNAALGFTPVFPSIPVRSGDRLSFDLVNATIGTSIEDATATVVIEFHGRRVKQ